ncbi:MAG: hypothetical protein R3Y43_06175 [Alphaproteobacteria bacterium]
MKKIILFLFLFLCGCSSLGKGIANAFLDKSNEEDTRACTIEGTSFEGINSYFSKGNVVKVLMVHGVGSHNSGYSARLQENLMKSLGLDVVSRRSKKISLVSPEYSDKSIGTLLVTRYQNVEETKEMLFYELTWSKITQEAKDILSYDSSNVYAYKRAKFNQAMKSFLNDTGPDPLVYLSDKKSLILDAFKQSECWMFGYDWDALPDDVNKVCKISTSEQLRNLENEEVVFITHSLGSRILVDAFSDIVLEIKSKEIAENKSMQASIEVLKNKKFTVFMLANQLPILQIGNKAPDVVGQYDSYCVAGGNHYKDRVFANVNIVAFSDPNDILSYDIPQRFVDAYMDSRMCPNVTNVDINISKEISAFGLGVVNPLTAHTEYDNDDRVIDIISYGTQEDARHAELEKRCEFIYLK